MNVFEGLENEADVSAQALERYRTKFFSAIDQMNAKATQSKKMMDILPETSSIQRIDRFFLGIGDRLEQMAKKGTAANLAISMLGRNASLKDIFERIKLINQGLARMQSVALAASIVFAGLTPPPDPKEVFFERVSSLDFDQASSLEELKPILSELKAALLKLYQ
jgi:hypothetical protein